MAKKNTKAKSNKQRLESLYLQERILRVAKYFRVILIVYAVLAFIFWLLTCIEADWLYRFAWFFEIPYRIVNLIYKPQGIQADFSLAIIGGVSLLLGFVSDYFVNNNYEKVIESIVEEERKIEEEKEARKQAARAKRLAAQANSKKREMQALKAALVNSKLLFLIMPNIKKVRHSESDIGLTFREVELIKQRINKKLIESLNYSKPLQIGAYKNNLYLLYKDFNFTDEFIYYLRPTIASIIPEYKKMGLKVFFCYVFSTISDVAWLEKELDCMDTVMSLKFMEEYIATVKFKNAYDNLSVHKNKLELMGEYNLSKNLSVSNKQALYKIVTEDDGEE